MRDRPVSPGQAIVRFINSCGSQPRSARRPLNIASHRGIETTRRMYRTEVPWKERISTPAIDRSNGCVACTGWKRTSAACVVSGGWATKRASAPRHRWGAACACEIEPGVDRHSEVGHRCVLLNVKKSDCSPCISLADDCRQGDGPSFSIHHGAWINPLLAYTNFFHAASRLLVGSTGLA